MIECYIVDPKTLEIYTDYIDPSDCFCQKTDKGKLLMYNGYNHNTGEKNGKYYSSEFCFQDIEEAKTKLKDLICDEISHNLKNINLLANKNRLLVKSLDIVKILIYNLFQSF